MRSFYKNYDDAYNAAIEMQALIPRDVGIEKKNGPLEFGYSVFRLPNPENRYGHELTCEVVPVGSPKIERKQ